MARGAIARLIAANLCRNTPNPKDVIIEQPTPKLFKMADEAMLWLSMPMTRQLEVDGQLTSLAITWERGICYTAGRIPEVAATKILTAKMIPVLHKDSKLAKMIMIQAHREDHRRMPQKTMKHLYVSRDLNLLEFDTLLRKAANCLNDRPLSVYDVNDGEPGLAPLTPNLMLQNFRAPSALEALDKYEECTDKLVVRN